MTALLHIDQYYSITRVRAQAGFGIIAHMNQDSILKFKPNVHPALWGGESWEISVHPAGPSVIREGVLAGKPLSEAAPGFPLLVKVIDAKMRLSVQVHPNETTCKLTGGDPKTEMWAMLEDGVIYAGLKPGVGPKDVEEAVKSGRFEELLVRHDAKKGEAFFIPGGLVHAIGDGALIYEVQQSSDTTFRLYDWNRVSTIRFLFRSLLPMSSAVSSTFGRSSSTARWSSRLRPAAPRSSRRKGRSPRTA